MWIFMTISFFIRTCSDVESYLLSIGWFHFPLCFDWPIGSSLEECGAHYYLFAACELGPGDMLKCFLCVKKHVTYWLINQLRISLFPSQESLQTCRLGKLMYVDVTCV